MLDDRDSHNTAPSPPYSHMRLAMLFITYTLYHYAIMHWSG